MPTDEMKYGKLLTRARRLSNPTWQESWLDYHSLKGLIYTIRSAKNGLSSDEESHATTSSAATATSSSSTSSSTTTTSTSTSASSTPDESSTPTSSADQGEQGEQSRTFFEKLREELKKVSTFYNNQEIVHLERTTQFAQELQAAELMSIDETDLEQKETRVITLSRLMESCKVLYVDLMMLENFAVMNYGGFAKILKKHDKNTSFITQEKYLRKVVNVKPFALYTKLKAAIALSESSFTRLVDMMPCEETASNAVVQGRDMVVEQQEPVVGQMGPPGKRKFSPNDASKLSSLRQISEDGQKMSTMGAVPSILRASSPASKLMTREEDGTTMPNNKMTKRRRIE